MVGGTVSAFFGALHYWWPKMTGTTAEEPSVKDLNREIAWFDAAANPTSSRPCLACRAVEPLQPVLEIPSPNVVGDTIGFARCSACGSLTATTDCYLEYADEVILDPIGLRHYLHIGAAIESMVRPVERLRANGPAPLKVPGCAIFSRSAALVT